MVKTMLSSFFLALVILKYGSFSTIEIFDRYPDTSLGNLKDSKENNSDVVSTKDVIVNSRLIRLSFYYNGATLNQQVNIELYHEGQTDYYYHTHTTDGYYDFNLITDKKEKVILWTAQNKTIELEINNSDKLNKINLHFKNSSDNQLKSVHGRVYSRNEDPYGKYLVKLSDDFNNLPKDSTETSDGILSIWKGFFKFNQFGVFDAAVLLVFDNLKIKLNNINDDVEIDVVLDDDGFHGKRK